MTEKDNPLGDLVTQPRPSLSDDDIITLCRMIGGGHTEDEAFAHYGVHSPEERKAITERAYEVFYSGAMRANGFTQRKPKTLGSLANLYDRYLIAQGEGGAVEGLEVTTPNVSITNRQFVALVAPHQADIVAKLVDLAKSGDTSALRLILDRTTPAPKGATRIELPAWLVAESDPAEQARIITEAAMSGQITLEEAQMMIGLIEKRISITDSASLHKRLENVEKVIAGHTAKDVTPKKNKNVFEDI